ncbi:hypothetical protein [Thiolapillus sp.]|uniref:hypothetical protein n=1 Tax=Thiolapillus sp. TaxID=2017437 RepID=UPI003AF83F40
MGHPSPKIDSTFDNLLVPQPSWSPSTTQQLRKLVAAPYLSPNDRTPRLDAYVASPLALCARRVSSAASRLLGTTRFRFALHGWQRSCIFMPRFLQSHCLMCCRETVTISPARNFWRRTRFTVSRYVPRAM